MVDQEPEEPTDSWNQASPWGSAGNGNALSVTKMYWGRLMPGTVLGTRDTDQNPALGESHLLIRLDSRHASKAQSTSHGAKYQRKQAGRDETDGRRGASSVVRRGTGNWLAGEEVCATWLPADRSTADTLKCGRSYRSPNDKCLEKRGTLTLQSLDSCSDTG